MSYRTVSSKRPYGDEWVQMQCDGCGALGPRVEVTLPQRHRGVKHEVKREAVLKLAKQLAGFTDRLRPWRTASGRAGKGQVVEDVFLTREDPRWAAVHATWQVALGRLAEEQKRLAEGA